MRTLPTRLVVNGVTYVRALPYQYQGPDLGGDTSKIQRTVLKSLNALILRHYSKTQEFASALQKNPKDATTYRNWREHKRFIRLFKNLKVRVQKDASQAKSVDSYLRAMKDTSDFRSYWEGLKDNGIKVDAIPDDYRWPSPEKYPLPPLGVIPSQNLLRPVR